MKVIEIPLNKSKVGVIVFSSAAFVFAGSRLAFSPQSFQNRFISNPLILQIFGVIAMLIFLFLGIMTMRKLLDKKMGLVINELGITDHSTATSIGLIRWEDIEDISELNVWNSKLIGIRLKNPEPYKVQVSSRLTRKTLEMNRKSYNTDVLINTQTLKTEYRSLKSQIDQAWKNYFENL